MFEIELKAHVYNKEDAVNHIKTFASFLKTVERNDVYYRKQLEKPLNGKDYISVRIRRETQKGINETSEKVLLTYKKKEIRTAADNTTTEVNDEKECTLSDAEPLEAFITDAGFVPYLKKQKFVEDYTFQSEYGEATIELCNVPPLGDFIEIEILSPSCDEKIVAEIQKQLRLILDKCNISEDCIENRYYSEMLSEIKK